MEDKPHYFNLSLDLIQLDSLALPNGSIGEFPRRLHERTQIDKRSKEPRP